MADSPVVTPPVVDQVPDFSPEPALPPSPTLAPSPTDPGLAPTTPTTLIVPDTSLFTPSQLVSTDVSSLPALSSPTPTPSISSFSSVIVLSTSISSSIIISSISSSISSSIAESSSISVSTTPAVLQALTPDPTAPPNSNDAEWIAGYLTIHFGSVPSWWYLYIFWFIIAGVIIIFSVLHALRVRGGYIGAYWSKWSLRRRTWRKKHALALAAKKGQKHRQPQALPSNAQIASLSALVLLTLAVAYIGPDYLAPNARLWNVNDAPWAENHHRRDDDDSDHPLSDYFPHYNIGKAWWTSATRTGQVAYALFPLVVLLALKARPFALLALPFTLNLHFDKLAWIHHWAGVLVWAITTLHVISWSVQLFKDHRAETGKIVYAYAFLFPNFVYAWCAYIMLTLLMLCSLEVVRKHVYEFFYLMHILLVPPMLIMAGWHHPDLWAWCWAALALWLCDRLYRFVRFLYNNGFLRNIRTHRAHWKQRRQRPMSIVSLPENLQLHTINLGTTSSKASRNQSRNISYPSAAFVNKLALYAEEYLPPPGFFHADMLTGKTIRLRIVPPGHMTWAPGQHFLLTIPAISNFTSHPFTVASVCDETVASGDNRELVFLVRAKGGFTKRLWDTVASMIARGARYPHKEKLPPGCELPTRGVLFRGYIDGPFGSAARARWGDYSSVLLVTGGSGVSFGLSVLEYVCLCLSGRDGALHGGQRGGYGKHGYKTTRVRFVWLAREFGHLQWGAATLRRCMAMCPAPELQIDIFVTNMKPSLNPTPPPLPTLEEMKGEENMEEMGQLLPPDPQFSRNNRFDRADKPGSRPSSVASAHSVDEDGFREDIIDTTYYQGDYATAERSELGHEEHVLDLTNFDGDDDTAVPGELQLNVKVQKEGDKRRSYKRKLTAARAIKMEKDKQNPPGVYQATPSPSQVSFRVDKEPSSPPRVGSPLSQSFGPGRRQQMPSQDLGKKHSDIFRHASSPSMDNLLGGDQQYPPMYTPETEEYMKSRPPSKYGDVESGSPPDAKGGPYPNEKDGASDIETVSRTGHPRDDSSFSGASLFSDSGSLVALVSDAAEHVKLDLNDTELADISLVAERARPGRPKFDMLLSEEIELSRGPLIVGCCGPTGLNAMVRKAVAAQIDPARIRLGDMRGSIALVAEDFEY